VLRRQKISLGPPLDEAEAQEALEKFITACGVSDAQLEKCDITVAPRRGRPALLTLACPTAAATDAVIPESDGLARTANIVCGRGRYVLYLAFANTDEADALLAPPAAPPMSGEAVANAPPAAHQQMYTLVIIQEEKGTMPTDGPREVETLVLRLAAV
jgi:hypothetical protein